MKYLICLACLLAPVAALAEKPTLTPIIESVSAWPKKGEVFVKGCYALDIAVRFYYDTINTAPNITTEVLARVCINGELHFRTREEYNKGTPKHLLGEAYFVAYIRKVKGAPTMKFRAMGARVYVYEGKSNPYQ
jgi:hypothetical protein